MSLNSSDLIKRSFVFTKDNAIPLVATGVVLMAPYSFLYAKATGMAAAGTFNIALAVTGVMALVVALVSTFLLQAAVSTMVFQRSPSGHVQLEQALPRALARVFPMVITSLLVGLGIFFGYLFFIIPGLIIALGLAVAVPMSVAEDVEPMEAVKRSWEMTNGHKLDIFVTVLLFSLVMIPLFMVVFFITFVIGFALGFIGIPASILGVALGTLTAATLNLPGQVLIAMLYEELRGIAATPQMMDQAPGYAPPQYGQAAPPMGPPPAGPPAQ